MNERERIIALVREGIISTEEAIELLENAAKKHGKDAMRKTLEQSSTTRKKKFQPKSKQLKKD